MGITETMNYGSLMMLYYEAHVTIEPVFGPELDRADRIAESHGFKVADLLMKREREGTEERSDKDTFMSARSYGLMEIITMTRNLVQDLTYSGIKVWRYKIEDTLLDSKISNPGWEQLTIQQ